MSKVYITNGNAYGEYNGVSNTIYIESNEKEYDEQGQEIRINNQHIWFDAHSQEFKDFVKTINDLNYYV